MKTKKEKQIQKQVFFKINAIRGFCPSFKKFLCTDQFKLAIVKYFNISCCIS